MKIGALVLGLVGAWIILTILIGGANALTYNLPMLTGISNVAPYTALVLTGVGFIIVACDLYDLAEKS